MLRDTPKNSNSVTSYWIICDAKLLLSSCQVGYLSCDWDPTCVLLLEVHNVIIKPLISFKVTPTLGLSTIQQIMTCWKMGTLFSWYAPFPYLLYKAVTYADSSIQLFSGDQILKKLLWLKKNHPVLDPSLKTKLAYYHFPLLQKTHIQLKVNQPHFKKRGQVSPACL